MHNGTMNPGTSASAGSPTLVRNAVAATRSPRRSDSLRTSVGLPAEAEVRGFIVPLCMGRRGSGVHDPAPVPPVAHTPADGRATSRSENPEPGSAEHARRCMLGMMARQGAATDPVAEFFDGLAAREHEPLLEKAAGTFRLDVLDGKRTERWFLTLAKGDLAGVARPRRGGRRHARRAAARREARPGKANALSAVLRGAMTVEGNPDLLVLFQRLLPRPRDARASGRAAGHAGRRR